MCYFRSSETSVKEAMVARKIDGEQDGGSEKMDVPKGCLPTTIDSVVDKKAENEAMEKNKNYMVTTSFQHEVDSIDRSEEIIVTCTETKLKVQMMKNDDSKDDCVHQNGGSGVEYEDKSNKLGISKPDILKHTEMNIKHVEVDGSDPNPCQLLTMVSCEDNNQAMIDLSHNYTNQQKNSVCIGLKHGYRTTNNIDNMKICKQNKDLGNKNKMLSSKAKFIRNAENINNMKQNNHFRAMKYLQMMSVTQEMVGQHGSEVACQLKDNINTVAKMLQSMVEKSVFSVEGVQDRVLNVDASIMDEAAGKGKLL